MKKSNEIGSAYRGIPASVFKKYRKPPQNAWVTSDGIEVTPRMVRNAMRRATQLDVPTLITDPPRGWSPGSVTTTSGWYGSTIANYPF